MWRAPRLCFSVVTSFTFFGELQFLNLDREWRQAEANQARAIFDETKRHVREMVTAAWIDAEVRQLDPDTQNAFALFFRNVAHSSNSTVTSGRRGETCQDGAVGFGRERKEAWAGWLGFRARSSDAGVNESIDGALPENRSFSCRVACGQGRIPNCRTTHAYLAGCRHRFRKRRLRQFCASVRPKVGKALCESPGVRSFTRSARECGAGERGRRRRNEKLGQG